MKYLNSIETWNVFVLTILLTITNSRDYATGVELCLTQKKMVRVAVVTGGNRGLGFAIVKKLCETFQGVVILTARDGEKGLAACEDLKKDGFQSDFYQVDVTDEKTVEGLKNYIKSQYGGLDVLINNAGIYCGPTSSFSYAEQVRLTVDCDYFGLRNVCKRLFPLLRPYARVVNISSRMGKYSCLNPPAIDRISSHALTEDDLDKLMDQFKKDVQSGKQKQEGWPTDSVLNYWQNSAYCVTKLAVTILTRLQANFFVQSSKSADQILVNACCPGWLKTRLGGPDAPLSTEEGAETPVYLALLPPESKSPNGKFLFERKVVPFVKAPCVRLCGVHGHQGRSNDVVFCGTEAQQHVVYFHGDVQDYVENMAAHSSNKAWVQWDLETTSKLLSKQFPGSFIWVVKSSRLHLGTYACYDNFVETSVFGVPDHNTNIGAIPHLRLLLDTAVRKVLNLEKHEEDVTEDFPIILIGFSHGCVVLNQIVHEVHDILKTEKTGLLKFISRINSIHWLDAGHCGQSNAWVTDERLLGTLAETIPRIRVHLTPYQIRDKSRAWIGEEQVRFTKILKSRGADIKSQIYFEDQGPSLCNHFKLLETFDPAMSPSE